MASSMVCTRVQAFTPTSSMTSKYLSSSMSTKRSNVIVRSSVTAEDLRVNGDVAKTPSAWDCDEDANCVQVDACDEESCRTTLDVRIHGEWYDLSGEKSNVISLIFTLIYWSG